MRKIIGIPQGTRSSPFQQEFTASVGYCEGWNAPWRFCYRCERVDICGIYGKTRCFKEAPLDK
jgi:hypothetical protein